MFKFKVISLWCQKAGQKCNRPISCPQMCLANDGHNSGKGKKIDRDRCVWSERGVAKKVVQTSSEDWEWTLVDGRAGYNG